MKLTTADMTSPTSCRVFNCHKLRHIAEGVAECSRNKIIKELIKTTLKELYNVEAPSSQSLCCAIDRADKFNKKVRHALIKEERDIMVASYNVFPPPQARIFALPTLDLSNSWPKAVNTARPNTAIVNSIRANQVNAVKASACEGHPQKEDQGYVDSGCSRHMTRNMSYLSDFKEFDGGYVTFWGVAKGGKITGKGTLKTVPRKNNMYNVDMKNIVPKESLTCLVAKATLDESMLWHRRLCHINFKNINKLVKDNLARGLPSKRFENDQTFVACLKGKQHKASFNTALLCARIVVLIGQASQTRPLMNLIRGKFDGKSDDGFFVGYSLNSKDFRVYNIRTRKVEENLHVRFLEDKSIIAGAGPKWLFDIDVLLESMNYVPVIAGINSNVSTGTKESIDGSLFDSSSKNASNDEPQLSNHTRKKNDDSEIDNQERPEKSSQDVNTVGPSINTASTNDNTGSLNINTGIPTVNSTPLEDTHADFFGDETEVDMRNISTTYPVSSTPNTRIHKDHSLAQVIGDIQYSVQTRRMINEQGFISAVI
ncbi:putative ribonuclease H-like domain-containing protein [Tanacetum coccineum]